MPTIELLMPHRPDETQPNSYHFWLGKPERIGARVLVFIMPVLVAAGTAAWLYYTFGYGSGRPTGFPWYAPLTLGVVFVSWSAFESLKALRAAKFDGWFREFMISPQTIQCTTSNGRTSHYKWSELRGVSPGSRTLHFDGGRVLKLHYGPDALGRITTDMKVIISLIGDNSLLARALRDYQKASRRRNILASVTVGTMLAVIGNLIFAPNYGLHEISAQSTFANQAAANEAAMANTARVLQVTAAATGLILIELVLLLLAWLGVRRVERKYAPKVTTAPLT